MNEYAWFFLNREQQILYRELRSALFAHAPCIQASELPVDQIQTTIKAVLTDTPELFWFEGKWALLNRNSARYLVPVYTFEVPAAREIARSLAALRADFCGAVSDDFCARDEMRAVFDYLLSRVRYEMTPRGGQTIYDALIEGKAVCKGISKAYQFLLQGRHSFSTLREGTLDGAGKHVWNIVKINSGYYHVDVCMGYDQFSHLYDEREKSDPYRCFLVSDEKIQITHRLIDSPWPSPSCRYDDIGDDENAD